MALGIGATGGLLGAVLAARVVRAVGAGRTIALGGVLFSAPFAALPLIDGPLWLRMAGFAAVEFVGGFGVMLLDIPLNALQTTVTPDAVRSRVAGAFSTINYGARPVGALLGGLLGDWIGIAPTLVLAAIGGSLAVLWLVRSPILRVRAVEDVELPATIPA